MFCFAGLLCAAPSVAGAAPGTPAARPRITITQPWSRATAPGAQVGVAYLTIVNEGPADQLIAVRGNVAARVEVHLMSMNDGEMQMRPLTNVAVPARGRLVFAPGGYHIMLIDLRAPLREGSRFTLQLQFRSAGSVDVEVPVLGLGAMAAAASATAEKSDSRGASRSTRRTREHGR